MGSAGDECRTGLHLNCKRLEQKLVVARAARSRLGGRAEVRSDQVLVRDPSRAGARRRAARSELRAVRRCVRPFETLVFLAGRMDREREPVFRDLKSILLGPSGKLHRPASAD